MVTENRKDACKRLTREIMADLAAGKWMSVRKKCDERAELERQMRDVGEETPCS